MPSTSPCIVEIISVSYSGSTWLNLLLGTHDRAFSVGEIVSIDRSEGPIECSRHGDACPVWSHVKYSRQQTDIFSQLQQLTQKDIFVVNNPRRLSHLLDVPGFKRKTIHLVRDGRAVIASTIRKYPETTAWAASRHWSRTIKKNLGRFKARPESDKLLVRYEDLSEDTEANLQRICSFIGTEFQPSMLSYWGADHCFMGGSRGTLFSVANKRNEVPRSNTPIRENIVGFEKEKGFYTSQDPASFTDERWRSELTTKQLRVFKWAAGRLNRKFGYGT